MLKLGSLAVLLFVSAKVAAAEPSLPTNTLRVVASAKVTAKPDRAELELGVTTDKKTATAATAENKQKMEKVLAVLKKEVGAGGEVKTSQLSVSPRYAEGRQGETTAQVLGYTVTNTVLVRVADIQAVGRLLDLSFQAGANTIEGVRFTLKNPDAPQNEALRAASAKARARAAAMADGLGLKVGQIVAVSEGDRNDFLEGGGGMRFMKSANVSELPLEPGNIEVSATVTVIFALAAK